MSNDPIERGAAALCDFMNRVISPNSIWSLMTEVQQDRYREMVKPIFAAQWRAMESARKIDQEPIILWWEGYPPMEGYWCESIGTWIASGPPTPSSKDGRWLLPELWQPLPAPPLEDK